MTSPIGFAVITFMVCMIFLNVVVFGTDPLIIMFYDDKDDIEKLNCNQLHQMIDEGKKGWQFAFAQYYMDCKNHEMPKIVNMERGEFYRYEDGGLISSKHVYDGFYELIPTEIDELCTFKVTRNYEWCANVFGEEGLFENESLDVCNDGYYQAMRIDDGSCVAIFNFGWVDDYNRAVQETEFEITPMYKVRDWNDK